MPPDSARSTAALAACTPAAKPLRFDRCGTFGCILADRHPGLHIFEQAAKRQRPKKGRLKIDLGPSLADASDGGASGDRGETTSTRHVRRGKRGGKSGIVRPKEASASAPSHTGS